MKKYEIDIKDTGQFSKMVLDYVEGKEELKAFYNVLPDMQNVLSLSESKGFSESRRELICNKLMAQNKNLPENAEVLKNIETLRENTSYSICTGHQLCLMGGPLFVFLKIISVINTAQKLNELQSGKSFVPIFWMASEDHDFEEINHIHLFNKKIVWEGEKGPHVGDMSLAGIEKFRDQLFEILGEGEYVEQIKDIFNSSYSEEKTLAEAMRSFIHHFFGGHGLLILDANDHDLKQSFSSILEDELIEGTTASNVGVTIAEMANSYKVQANPSEVNLFFLSENERQKISKENGFFKFSEEIWQREKTLEALKKEPEKFSPNVLLRPLYQETILPNVAYVGGGGEIAYWLELKKLFSHHNVQFPALMLRNSLLWIDSNIQQIMNDFDISVKEIFNDEESLVKRYVNSKVTDDQKFEKEKADLEKVFQSIKQKAVKIDKNLERTVDGEFQKVVNSIEKLNSKVLKGLKVKSDQDVKKIRKIKQKLFPDGKLSERKETFVPLYLKHGPSFLNVLFQQIDPFTQKFTVLSEEDS